MKKDLPAIDDALADFSKEEKENAITHSVNVIDLLSSTAIDIIINFVENQRCPEAKALLTQPEVLAVKAMEAALRHLIQGGRGPADSIQ